MKYILVFGNPIDGFTFRGPFESSEDAIAYGDPIMEEWWTAELTPPETIEHIEFSPTIDSGGQQQ
jgi:hypothetical protein